MLSQCRAADEVIVIDDGSTDNTRAVCERFGGAIRYIQQRNAGPGAARNAGIREASGDWIAFLDHDDQWHPTKLQRQCAAIDQNPDAILCYTGLMMCRPEGKYDSPAYPSEKLWPTLRWRNPITPSATMVRRDVLVQTGGFTTTIKGTEDWEMWVRLYTLGYFTSVPDCLVDYREFGVGLSSDPKRMLHCTEQMLGTLLADLSGISRWIWKRRILTAQLYSAAIIARDQQHSRDEGQHLLLQAVLNWPSPFFQPRRYRALLHSLLH